MANVERGNGPEYVHYKMKNTSVVNKEGSLSNEMTNTLTDPSYKAFM